jgi:nifR3 family TIM-barrel protein
MGNAQKKGTTLLRVENSPLVMLAPMAGITDLPFRQIVQGYGVDLVVSEMVASHDMVNARPGSRERAELGLDQSATAVQLAGRDPFWIAEAARIVEGNGAQVIDINMGCPAKKVTGGQSGSALMRDLDLAVAMIRAVVDAVSVPVTLKCRLGWDDATLNAPVLARAAEAEGITRITVHGRTRCQFYKGKANWTAIAQVVEAVDIPVIANGDIVDADAAREALAQSGAAGVMVGRGVQGQPWLPAQIRANLHGLDAPVAPVGAELCALVKRHYQAVLDFYGPDIGLRTARKHLSWYMDRAEVAPSLRNQILTSKDTAVVIRLLDDAFDTCRKAVA